MSEIAQTKTADVSVTEPSVVKSFSNETTSIRVSPNSYFTALFVATFFSAFLVYLEIDWAAILLFAAAWLILPVLLWTDRITFDGRRLSRTGILPNLWATFNNSRTRLRLSDIEQVETQAQRALKRGGNIFYRYRTAIRGKETQLVFASGGEDYRRMIRQIFPRLSENVLDTRSIELRDYFAEPKETLMKAEFAHIPSAEVLESATGDFKFSGKTAKTQNENINAGEIEKADELHRLANELRLAGFLLQSLEAFRRALVLNPRNARLIFDFARCLNSFAGSEKSGRLQRKSLAALRLAERRAGGDGELLARLGESYFQFGDFGRAKAVFQKALDIAGESFRSVRGLAEIALREGKIAHVIHHFSTANRLAETTALRRWTQSEADYFAHLNDDDEYMEIEISRVNMLVSLENYQKTALKAALFGFPAILIGVLTEDDLIANIGWAISSIALVVWVIMIISQRMLSARIPFEMIESDEEDF